MKSQQVAAFHLSPFKKLIESLPPEVREHPFDGGMVGLALEIGGVTRHLIESTEQMRKRAHLLVAAVDQIIGPLIMDGTFDKMVEESVKPCGLADCDCHAHYGQSMTIIAQLKPLMEATINKNLNEIADKACP